MIYSYDKQFRILYQHLLLAFACVSTHWRLLAPFWLLWLNLVKLYGLAVIRERLWLSRLHLLSPLLLMVIFLKFTYVLISIISTLVFFFIVIDILIVLLIVLLLISCPDSFWLLAIVGEFFLLELPCLVMSVAHVGVVGVSWIRHALWLHLYQPLMTRVVGCWSHSVCLRCITSVFHIVFISQMEGIRWLVALANYSKLSSLWVPRSCLYAILTIGVL